MLLAIVLVLLIWGCYYLVHYSNGTTSAQIEAQERMKAAGEEMQNTMQEQGQWYKDRLKEYDN